MNLENAISFLIYSDYYFELFYETIAFKMWDIHIVSIFETYMKAQKAANWHEIVTYLEAQVYNCLVILLTLLTKRMNSHKN